MTEQGMALLTQHEGGMKLKPYDDKSGGEFRRGDVLRGHLTISIGVNLSDGLTVEEAEFLFRSRVRQAVQDAQDLFSPAVWATMGDARQDAFTNMAFNLGYPRLVKFQKMVQAAEVGNWDRAANEMLDSVWSQQVGRRSHQLAEMVRTGDYVTITSATTTGATT